jgi:hypothetical protein
MQEVVPPEGQIRHAPRFYLSSRQPLRPEVILLAVVVAVAGLGSMLFALQQSRLAKRFADSSGGAVYHAAAKGSDANDEKDDPTQIDTIVLGDPTDAPVPARKGNHVSPVHPTIVVRLPRTGDRVGMIPDSAAGKLLYGWLAAFNQGSYPALRAALPNAAPDSAVAAQMALREQTGGLNLVSAKEVQPGVLVFRVRDQTPAGGEALGTLQVRPDSNPARIASFSLRAVPAAGPDETP